MKHLKLIAALAMPAMFAACTSEDLYSEGNNTPQQMEEVVGYKLVSNGASFQVAGAESRVSAGTGNFHSTDLIGLGWVLNGNAVTEQFANKLPNTNRLYANHMFSWDEETGFGTKGNIYEGWHFAYYPWGYEKKMGAKTFVVNPDQKSKSADDRVSQRLQISHLQFVDESNVDPNNGELNLSYQLEKALNIINVRTTVAKGSAFEAKEAEGLDDKAIRSITISTGDEGQKIFAGKLNLEATKLPVYNAELDKDDAKTVKEENKEVLLNALYDVTDSDPALVKADLSSSVTTYIGERKTVGEGEASVTTQDVVYKVSESAKLYTILAPAQATLDKTKFNIVISLDNGYFEVKYINPETLERELTEAEKKNNAAIEKLVNAFAGEVEAGEKEATTLTRLQEGAMPVDVVLYDDIFVTDFKHISNIIEWKDAVDLVETLGRTSEVFEIDGAIEFTTANGGITAEGNLYMPSTCQITVSPSNCEEDTNKDDNNLYLNGELVQWPANLASNAWLAVEANGVWNNAHINKQNGRVVNRGTIVVPNGTKDKVNVMANYITNSENALIKVGEYAQVSSVNNKGRIEVVWGSYVYTTENKGIIAYEVQQKDVDQPKRIVILTTEQETSEQKKLASVNTLIIGKNIEIDLTKKIGATDDNFDNNPYGDFNLGGGSDEYVYNYGNLQNVNFEINGGTVVSTTNTLTVNNVKMNGGLVNNITINELTIESGVNYVNVSDPKSISKLEIKGGNSTVYATEINADVTAKGENAIHADKINGSLTVEGKHHEIVVAEITGNVVISDNATISNTSVAQYVEVKSGATGMENVVINGNLVNKGTVKAFNLSVVGNLTNEGSIEFNKSEETVEIGSIVNKGTLTTNANIITASIELFKGSETTVFEGDEETPENFIWYTTPRAQGGYVQAGKTTGKIEFYGATEFINAINNAQAGETVVLQTSLDLSTALVITKNITIDLNGKSIVNTGNSIYVEGQTSALITVSEGAEVTIKNGTVDGGEEDYAVEVRGGILNIENGTYSGACTAAYAFDGTINVLGGEFKVNNQESQYGTTYTLNKKDRASANIIVKGGKFYLYNPANNNSENPQESFVAEGFTSVQNGDYYEVSAN